MKAAIPTLQAKTRQSATACDDQLLHRLNRAFVASGQPGIQRIQVSVHEGLVALRGTVGTYYQKQLAQETAMHVRGVEALTNEIVVR